jgi:predicted PurR-regulated permease PerM
MSSERENNAPSSYVNDGGWTRARVVFLSIAFGLLVALIWLASEVLLPFILGLVIAYVLTPLVAFCERRRLPRSVSILLVYAVVLGGLYAGVATAAPRLVKETVSIVRDLPSLADRMARVAGPRIDQWIDKISSKPIEGELVPHAPAFEIHPQRGGGYTVDVGAGVEITQDTPNRYRLEPLGGSDDKSSGFTRMVEDAGGRFVEYVKKNSFELLKLGRDIVATASRGIFLVFMTLMVAGFLMHTREKILGFLRGLIPWKARGGFDQLLFRIDRGLSGVVRGQLLICAVNGVLSAIGFWWLELKYWPVLALVAAVGSLIPIFGSIIAAVPAVAIGLSVDFWKAFWALILILGIHQLEANLLNPKIIGTAARIHPVLVVFVLIVGEHYFGLWGALFAVPAWAVVQSLFLHFRSLVVPDAVDTLIPLWQAQNQPSEEPAPTPQGPASK